MRRLRGLAPILFLVLCVAIALGWRWYATADRLHPNYEYLRRICEPLYVIESVIDPADAAVKTRFATAIGVVVVCVGLLLLAIARRWRTTICLVLAVVGVLAINVSVAVIPLGEYGLTEPFSRQRLEYFPDVRYVRNDPIRFIEDYPTLNRRLGQHPATHPPGGILFLYFGGKAIDTFSHPPPPPTRKPNPFANFFGGEPPPMPRTTGNSIDSAAWLAIGTTAFAVLPTFWLALQVGGMATARRMLPLYLVAPNLITFGATSMDGVFLTFVMTALASGVWAMKRWSIVRPVVAGLALWLSTFLTFTSLVVPTVMGAFALTRAITRPWMAARMLLRCVAVGVVFIGIQALAMWLIHYDLRACAEAAMDRDARTMGTGYETAERFWTLSRTNLLAVLLGAGVGTIALLVPTLLRPSRRRRYAFAIAVVGSLVALCYSTLFTLETERVLLAFTPLLLIAVARSLRGWPMYLLAIVALAAQALWIELSFKTYW